MNNFDALYAKLREIAGRDFVSVQMLGDLGLSDDELITFLMDLERQGLVDLPQHAVDPSGRKYPHTFRLKA